MRALRSGANNQSKNSDMQPTIIGGRDAKGRRTKNGIHCEKLSEKIGWAGYDWPFGFETASDAISIKLHSWSLCQVSIRNPSAAQRRLH